MQVRPYGHARTFTYIHTFISIQLTQLYPFMQPNSDGPTFSFILIKLDFTLHSLVAKKRYILETNGREKLSLSKRHGTLQNYYSQ